MRYRCDICGEKFWWKKNLLVHSALHVPIVRPRYTPIDKPFRRPGAPPPQRHQFDLRGKSVKQIIIDEVPTPQPRAAIDFDTTSELPLFAVVPIASDPTPSYQGDGGSFSGGGASGSWDSPSSDSGGSSDSGSTEFDDG